QIQRVGNELDTLAGIALKRNDNEARIFGSNA
ncbi:MAG: hypothetical protein RIS80_494, partial [Actinomycetota bacterium]